MNLYDLSYLLGGTFLGFVIHRIINEVIYFRWKRKGVNQ